MATAEQRFEADKKFAYRALQDARQYVTDFDRTGSKAEALYERLARADRMMRPWSTDGTSAQAKKAIEYLQEITSILSEKIGPASRREFSEQGGTRHHATKKTPAQLQREIDEVLARKFEQSSYSVHSPAWEKERLVRKLTREKTRLENPRTKRSHATKTGAEASKPRTSKKPKKVRIVNVEAKTPAGYRWLKINARGATVTPEGFFAVTDEHEWAQSLAAAGAIEIK